MRVFSPCVERGRSDMLGHPHQAAAAQLCTLAQARKTRDRTVMPWIQILVQNVHMSESTILVFSGQRSTLFYPLIYKTSGPADIAWHDILKTSGLNTVWPFWSRFDPLQAVFIVLSSFEPVWPSLSRFGHFDAFYAVLTVFWAVLSRFNAFKPFWPFSSRFDCFEPHWPFLSSLTCPHSFKMAGAQNHGK